MITLKDVEHIAHLARIELTPEEKQKYGRELSKILEFVEKLNRVDTSVVQPLAGGTLLENITREDEEADKTIEGKSAKLLEAAPDRKDGYVKVKSVFG